MTPQRTHQIRVLNAYSEHAAFEGARHFPDYGLLFWHQALLAGA